MMANKTVNISVLLAFRAFPVFQKELPEWLSEPRHDERTILTIA
jgi:hypothetical protein